MNYTNDTYIEKYFKSPVFLLRVVFLINTYPPSPSAVIHFHAS